MTIASDNVFPKVILEEGAAPATPSSGQVKVYAKSDGLVYSKDDAGVETGPFGGSGVADIVDIPTAETDTSLVLAPDGAGGVEFRAETGGGGGGLVLLESHTAANSSELVFATRNAAGQSGATFQSDYDVYIISLAGIVPANNSAELRVQLSSDGGSTWVSTSIYQYGGLFGYQGGSGGRGASGQSYWLISNNISNNSSQQGLSGEYRVLYPLSTSRYKQMEGHHGDWDSSASAPVWATGAYTCASTTAMNAIKFYMGTGNITVGTISVLGLPK